MVFFFFWASLYGLVCTFNQLFKSCAFAEYLKLKWHIKLDAHLREIISIRNGFLETHDVVSRLITEEILTNQDNPFSAVLQLHNPLSLYSAFQTRKPLRLTISASFGAGVWHQHYSLPDMIKPVIFFCLIRSGWQHHQKKGGLLKLNSSHAEGGVLNKIASPSC